MCVCVCVCVCVVNKEPSTHCKGINLDSSPASVLCWLCDHGQVTSPLADSSKRENSITCHLHQGCCLLVLIESLLFTKLCACAFWASSLSLSLFFFLINKFIYLFFTALGLRCCTWAFSSCSERGLFFSAVRGLLSAVASLVAEHGL